MTITVFGAGAIGGITGAALAKAGHDVLLVDRAADHVAAINAGGLTVERRQGAETVAVRAITSDALEAGLDLVLLAVKSQDTSAALDVIAPLLESNGVVVSLQNGLCEERVAKIAYTDPDMRSVYPPRRPEGVAGNDVSSEYIYRKTVDQFTSDMALKFVTRMS